VVQDDDQGFAHGLSGMDWGIDLVHGHIELSPL
jgi:hypothetical protein